MKKKYVSAADELVARIEENLLKTVKIGRTLIISNELPQKSVDELTLINRKIIALEFLEYLKQDGKYHQVRYHEKEIFTFAVDYKTIEMAFLIWPDPTSILVEAEE